MLLLDDLIVHRGLVSINALRRIEDLVGEPIHTMFDYMCGVSTGAVITAMLGKSIHSSTRLVTYSAVFLHRRIQSRSEPVRGDLQTFQLHRVPSKQGIGHQFIDYESIVL